MPSSEDGAKPQPPPGTISPMDGPRRAYDLLRGYVNREWERIQGVEDSYAERELREAMEVPTVPAPEPQHLRAEPTVDNLQLARRLLGVTVGATFGEIHQAFDRLNLRSDPNNFPPGSAEARQAAEIQKRVQWAYAVLTEGMDATEKRFRSLEID